MATGYGLRYYCVYDPGLDENGEIPSGPLTQIVGEMDTNVEREDAPTPYIMKDGDRFFREDGHVLKEMPKHGTLTLYRMDNMLERYGQEVFLILLRNWQQWKMGPGQRLLQGKGKHL
jgi:hypothetical protein